MGNDVGGPISARQDQQYRSWAGNPRVVTTGGKPAASTTDGTDTTPVVTEMYIADIGVPVG